MVVTPNERSSNEAGFALLLALFVLILAGAALSVLAVNIELKLRDVDQYKTRLNLMAIHDSVVAETMATMAQSSGTSGLPRRQIEGGWTESRVKRITQKRYVIETRVHFRGRELGSTTQVYLRKIDDEWVPEINGWQVGIE